MVFDKVQEIIAGLFGVDPESITEETEFVADLEADSLDVVELVMSIEEAFDLSETDEEDIKSIRTVGDLVAYVTTNMG